LTAVEMAVQLRKKKEEVMIVILDSQYGIKPYEDADIDIEFIIAMRKLFERNYFELKIESEQEELIALIASEIDQYEPINYWDVVRNCLLEKVKNKDFIEKHERLYKVIYYNLMMEYKVRKTVDRNVMYVVAKDKDIEERKKIRKKWQKSIPNMRYEEIEGNHSSMLKNKNAQDLSKRIIQFFEDKI